MSTGTPSVPNGLLGVQKATVATNDQGGEGNEVDVRVTDTSDALANVDMFAGLEPEARQRVMAVAVPRTYRKGQLLFVEGDPGESLIILSENGQLALVKASPEKYFEVSGFPALDGKTWNNPAIAEGYLLVRNTTEMACFRIGR